jgi:hypothetical protein
MTEKRKRVTDEKQCTDFFAAVDQYIQGQKDKAKKAKCQLSSTDMFKVYSGLYNVTTTFREDLEMTQLDWKPLEHVGFMFKPGFFSTTDPMEIIVIKFEAEQMSIRLKYKLRFNVDIDSCEDQREITAINDIEVEREAPTEWDLLSERTRFHVARLLFFIVTNYSKLNHLMGPQLNLSSFSDTTD